MAPLTNGVSRKKVAIIGSGVAGIGALWALNRTHHDVYMYEAAGRLGGHTNTVEWANGKHKTLVDTGFIVLNTATYPNFISFLKAMKIPTSPTEMTFGVSRDHGLFEWAGSSLAGVFAQKMNILSPRMWRMIFDIIRFNQFALDLLIDADESKVYVNGDKKDSGYINGNDATHRHRIEPELSIGGYLEQEGYSDAFRDDYLIPMTAAVWSTSPDKCSLDFPAVTLVRFMWNHHLLTTIGTRPQWLTIPRCSKAYLDAVMYGFPPNHLFLNTAAKSICNDSSGRVIVNFENGKSDIFDHVILATHGDQALRIISKSATPIEESILSSFQTSENTAILHSDLSLMPKRREAWSSWNYMTLSTPSRLSNHNIKSSNGSAATKLKVGNIDQICLTYNMNILQHLSPQTYGNVLVTLNPLHTPPKSAIQGSFTYRHPLYTSAAVRAQSLLPKIQNTRGISYVGAWTKYGFHEDAFSSGIKAAIDHLGASVPWTFVDSTFSRGRAPRLGMLDWMLRIWILSVQMVIVVIERIFGIERGTQPGVGRKKTS